MIEHHTKHATIDRAPRYVMQTGDLHLQDKDLDDQVPVLRWIADQAAEQATDVFIIQGDLAGVPCPHHATDRERNALATFIGWLLDAGVGLVVVSSGNHDIDANWLWINGGQGPDERMQGGDEPIRGWIDRVLFVHEPTTLIVSHTPSGYVTATMPLVLHVMPFPSPTAVLDGADVAPEEVDAELTRRLKGLFTSFAEAAEDAGDCPVIYSGHHGTSGALADNGQPLAREDVDVPWNWIVDTGCHLALLNHIHLPQLVTPSVIHVGSPYPMTAGELHEKRVIVAYVSQLTDGVKWTSLPTPCVPRLRARGVWTWDGDDPTDGAWVWLDEHEGVQLVGAPGTLPPRARLRVDLVFPKAVATTFKNAEIAALFGAEGVTVKRRPVAARVDRCPEIREAETPAELLAVWAEHEGTELPPACFDELALITVAVNYDGDH